MICGTSKLSEKSEQDWQAEDDLRTLLRAAEIYRDKSRLQRATALAKRQKQDLDKINEKGEAVLGSETYS